MREHLHCIKESHGIVLQNKACLLRQIESWQSSGLRDCMRTFDELNQTLRTGNRDAVHQVMGFLLGYLYLLKDELKPAQWQSFCLQTLRHPLNETLRQSPLIQHSQDQPRGYPGDAELLDLIYSLGDAGKKVALATPLGHTLNEQIFSWPAAQAVRRRGVHSSQVIDTVAYGRAARGKKTSVLSIACGHLREATFSSAAREKLLERYVGLDQDAKSLERLRQDYGHLGIETVHDSIGGIFKKRFTGNFDLVYSTGLWDYLNAEAAGDLLNACFAMLNPGGRLLIANFSKDCHDVGLMETFMKWNLIYRDRQEMEDLGNTLPQNEVERLEIYSEPLMVKSCLWYLDAVKAA